MQVRDETAVKCSKLLTTIKLGQLELVAVCLAACQSAGPRIGQMGDELLGCVLREADVKSYVRREELWMQSSVGNLAVLVDSKRTQWDTGACSVSGLG